MVKPCIYIVDDNDGFRQSVAFMLDASVYDIKQFSCAQTALDTLTDSQLSAPMCLLLDVRMPGLSGLDLHDKLRVIVPGLPVIYMTGHADVPLAVEAMKKGALTLLEKPIDPVALKQALLVASKQVHSQPRAEGRDAKQAIDSQNSNLQSQETLDDRREFEERLATLTPRERDVLEKLVEGLANKECAYELQISIRTVELHKSRLVKKLKVRTSSELMRYVLLHRISN